MKQYNNYDIEERLNLEGYTLIAGTDEVGRGPLVGPVVAAAVIMPKGCHIDGVTDSKKVSLKNRLILKEKIEQMAIAYAVSFVDAETIDEINIYEASRLAMMNALNSLKVKPDYVLSDAMPLNLELPSEAIIKGDEKSFTIGCASILAKVARDNYMESLDKEYPEYNFSKNKGYPTKEHFLALKKYGVLKEHRRSYKPVANELAKGNIYEKNKNN